jgi:hypothetical protein
LLNALAMIWLVLDKIPFMLIMDILLMSAFMFGTVLTMFQVVLILLAQWDKIPLQQRFLVL